MALFFYKTLNVKHSLPNSASWFLISIFLPEQIFSLNMKQEQNKVKSYPFAG